MLWPFYAVTKQHAAVRMQQQNGVKTAFVQNRYQHLVDVLGLDLGTDEKHLRRPEKELHHVGQGFLLDSIAKKWGLDAKKPVRRKTVHGSLASCSS